MKTNEIQVFLKGFFTLKMCFTVYPVVCKTSIYYYLRKKSFRKNSNHILRLRLFLHLLPKWGWFKTWVKTWFDLLINQVSTCFSHDLSSNQSHLGSWWRSPPCYPSIIPDWILASFAYSQLQQGDQVIEEIPWQDLHVVVGQRPATDKDRSELEKRGVIMEKGNDGGKMEAERRQEGV